MPAYKVLNGTYHAHGVRYRPGDIVDDLLPSALRASPDRFTLATDAEAAAYQAKQSALLTSIDPEDLAHVAAERAALLAQRADIDQKLAALPGGDPAKTLIEHAPTDPVTREHFEAVQASLAAAAQAEQEATAKAKTPLDLRPGQAARTTPVPESPSTSTPSAPSVPRTGGGSSSGNRT